MSYNNQPEWETYKPTIKEELYECEGADCDSKTKTQTKSYGALDMELCKDCWDGEYDCGCPSFIPYSYIMWGRNEEGEEEEVEICRRCSDDWEEKGWVYSNEYKDYEEYEREKAEKAKKLKKKKKKKFKIVKPSILIQEEQILDKLVIPIKYAMALFGDDEDEELEQCVGLDDARCSGKKIYSKTEELDLGMCKECYKKMDEEANMVD